MSSIARACQAPRAGGAHRGSEGDEAGVEEAPEAGEAPSAAEGEQQQPPPSQRSRRRLAPRRSGSPERPGRKSGRRSDLEAEKEKEKGAARHSFDVRAAIAACSAAGLHSHALYLARRHGLHAAYLRIQLEELRDAAAALAHLRRLPFDAALAHALQFGRELLRQLPAEATGLLVDLVSGNFAAARRPRPPPAPSAAPRAPPRPSPPRPPAAPPALPPPAPSRAGPSRRRWRPRRRRRGGSGRTRSRSCPSSARARRRAPLVPRGRRRRPRGPPPARVANALFECLLQEGSEGARARAARMAEEAPASGLDPHHGLLLCHAFGFRPGLVALLGRLGQRRELLRLHVLSRPPTPTPSSPPAPPRPRGPRPDPHAWGAALRFFARNARRFPGHLARALDAVEATGALSPLLVFRALAAGAAEGGEGGLTLGDVRGYLSKTLAWGREVAEALRQRTARARTDIDRLRSSAEIYQSSKCAACAAPLDLPAAHFGCGHAYHGRCLERAPSGGECPLCLPAWRQLEAVRGRLEAAPSSERHRELLAELGRAAPREDGFRLIPEFLAHARAGPLPAPSA
eukprot:tig00000806_g4348.t1